MIRAANGDPRVRQVQAAVAAAWGCEVIELRSRRQHRALVEPRHVAMYLARKLTTHSLPEIGREFDRDHTTVLYATAATQDRLARRPELRAGVDAIEAELREVIDRLNPVEAAMEDVLRDLRARLLAEARRDPVALLRRLAAL